MNQLRDEAFVLKTHGLGDTDLIVSLFARDAGKLRGVARAARRSHRRFGGALEPLTRVRVAWTERPGRELHRIERLEVVRSFAAMQSDPALQAACALVSEVSERLIREGQADPEAFRLVGAVLEALEAGGEVWGLVRYFEYWSLRIHGVLPALDRCSRCGSALRGRRTRIVGGSPVCAACARGAPPLATRRLGDAEHAFLREACTAPPSRLRANDRAVRPGGALESLLRGTLEEFAERRFRAYRHLGERAVTADRVEHS